jgi:hypothetical protein
MTDMLEPQSSDYQPVITRPAASCTLQDLGLRILTVKESS